MISCFLHDCVWAQAIFYHYVMVWKLKTSQFAPWWLGITPLYHLSVVQCADLMPHLISPTSVLERICIHGILNRLPHMLHVLYPHTGLLPCVMRRDSWVLGRLCSLWGFTLYERVALPYLTPSLCLRMRMQGRFIPSCDEDGYYRKQQCDRGECWCVDQNGGEVAGSRIRGKPDCGKSHRFHLSMYIYIFTNRIWGLECSKNKDFKMSSADWPSSPQHPPHDSCTRLPLC